MTTSHSPLSKLKAQADKIAQLMKACERGEPIPEIRFREKIEAARNQPSIKIGIVMDDKVITLDIKWTTLRDTSEVALAAMILKRMRDTREH